MPRSQHRRGAGVNGIDDRMKASSKVVICPYCGSDKDKVIEEEEE